ncbi:MAG: LAGLIDADG family homing endonuclease [Nanoarchaeota archaeon]
MRVKLRKGKQKELILKAKKELSWVKLAGELKINPQYLSYELKNEKRLISDKVYSKLSSIANLNFDKYILKKLEDNWGQSVGGNNSIGSTKKITKFTESQELAEIIGAVLGDGHVSFHSLNKGNRWIGTYVIRIAGDLEKDKDYHLNYLKPLCRKIFNLKAKEILKTKNNGRFLDLYSKELVKLFIKMGIKPGNKIKNQSTIPKWVFKKEDYIKSCLRGLIDTDGSVFRMSKRDYNLVRMNFTNHNQTLLEDTRNAFKMLGFNPSKIINNKQFFISRQYEINKYLKDIGFSNKKHKDRIKNLIAP